MLLFASGAAAQIGGNGAIQGMVSDATGAAIPGATVVATNEATQVQTTAQTTGKGFYVLSPLPPATYTVTVNANGFETVVQHHIIVNALQVVGLSLTMQVGSPKQEITVTSAPPVLDTQNGTLGATVPNEAYTALPLTMSNAPRSPTGFVALIPGVNTAAGTLHVNGGQGYTGNIYIDGQPMIFNELGADNRGVNFAISVDAVDQFQIDTSGTPAMYEGQGVQNYVLKSGTNSFHGDLFEFLRNTDLDSRGFFAATTPVEIQNEFGGTIGGPIKKDKLFFFAGYDGYRRRAGTNPSFESIPTAAERSGNFSALPVPIYDPATTNCNGSGPCTRLPFTGNLVPASRLSPIASALQAELPATVNGNLQDNFIEAFPNDQNNNEFQTKEDWAISDKNRLWGAFARGVLSDVAPGAPPSNGLPLPYAESRFVTERFYLAQLGDTYTISPTLLNQLNLSYNRLAIPIINETVKNQYPIKAGFVGLPPGQAADAFPRVTWAGPDAPTQWGGNGAEAFDEYDNNYSIQDDFEWVHGNHNFTFGTDLGKEVDTFFSPDSGSFPAVIAMSNTETAGFNSKGTLLTNTGNSYASFMLGEPDSMSYSYDAAAETASIDYRFAFYVQDDWKATRRLTLNLGLRYDIFTPFVEHHNLGSFLNPSLPNPEVNGRPGALEFFGYGPDSCSCRTPIQTHYLNFAPRLGFAYQLTDKMVLRGSYGIFYDRAAALGGGIDPESLSTLGYTNGPIIVSPDSGITPALGPNFNGGLLPGFAQPPIFDPTLNTGYNTLTGPKGGSITYGDYYLGGKPMYTESYNFGIERQLSSSMVLNVSYSGSQSHFVPTQIGRGIYSDQMDPEYLVLGNLLRASATPANIAAADNIIPGLQLPYPYFQGTIGQMLLPFPQYSGVSDPYSDIGNEYYNSLQVVVSRRMAKGLYFLGSFTYSREIGDAGSIKGGKGGGAGRGRTAYNNALEKGVSFIDIPEMATISEVYQLPFGSGHSLGSGNSVVRALVSDWEVSGIETYERGTPLGTVGASCNAPYTGACYASFNPAFSGPVRINGSYGTGDLLGKDNPAYINAAAFANPAAFTFGNTPPTLAYNLRNPPLFDEDFAVQRRFAITEKAALEFRAESFNAFNRVVFSGPSISNINSSGFGKITGQANNPRQFQLSAKIVF
jgi:hypothetical protein